MHVANEKPAGGEGWVCCADSQRTFNVRRTKVSPALQSQLFTFTRVYFLLRRGFGSTKGHKFSSAQAILIFCLILHDLCPGNSDLGGEECRDHPKGIGLMTPQELNRLWVGTPEHSWTLGADVHCRRKTTAKVVVHTMVY